MKKIIVTAVILLLSVLGIKAQYKTFTFGNKKYESQCQKLSNGTIVLSITLDGINPHASNPTIIMLTERQRVKFVNNLIMIRDKFMEYDSICKNSGVENISRIINHKDDIDDYPIILFDDDGKYYNTSPLFFAYVRKEGNSTMCIHSGELIDIKDEGVKSDGGLISFFNADEIDTLIRSFKEDEIMKYINLLD